jgi:branched-chain amino acid transport system permease protein
MIQQVLVEGVINGAIIALVAIGIALIWGVMNILNFAQGEFLMFGMYIAFFLNILLGFDPIFSVPICMIALFGLGFCTYKTMIRRVLKGPILSQRLLTFALSMVLQNVALMAFGGQFKTVPNLMFSGTVNLGSVTISINKLIPFITCLLLATALFLFINKTRTGKAIQATALDKDAAALVGINVEKSYTLAFALSAAITGAAGCILTYYYYISPGVGTTFQLFAFIAVAMGGFGSIPGALLGGILMGLVDTGTGVVFSTAFKYLAVCAAYILVVSLRPKGLFGR